MFPYRIMLSNENTLGTATVEKSHLDELIHLESTYWWHVAKRDLVTELIQKYLPEGSHLVEGGIGGAGNLLHWQSLGYCVSGLDVMPESVDQAKQRGLEHVYQHDLHLPWPMDHQMADGIILLDVLEHLKEPILALQQAARVLQPEGRILFTVPAYPWLFSEWDERLGHYRRYTAELLRDHVKAAGLRLELLRHWNAFSLPAALLVRIASRMGHTQGSSEFPRVSSWLNRTLISTARVERGIAGRIGMPLGLSLVGVIQK